MDELRIRIDALVESTKARNKIVDAMPTSPANPTKTERLPNAKFIERTLHPSTSLAQRQTFDAAR